MKATTIFDISGRGMAAQLVRLNTIASNLANAHSVAPTAAEAFRALRPVFETEFQDRARRSGVATVRAVDIEQTKASPERRFEPDHPLADGEGYVYVSNVDPNQELVEMLEAARQYSNNVEVIATAKALLIKTINVGK